MTKVHFERDDHSYRITLDDPPLHILDIAMLEELRDAISKIKDDRHCMIIASTGDRAFSAGASVQDHMGDRVATMLARFHDCFRMLARLDIVTIALVQGAALGGGCELALACDFVLAGERARFGQPEINLGVFPPVAAYQLSRQLSPRKGLELLLGGECQAWLQRIYKQSASSLRLAKKAFRLARSSDFDERLAAVERLYLEELMKTDDANEGLNAFIEKRKPVWKNG